MTKSEVKEFAHDFFSASANFISKNPRTFTISLGDKGVQVHVNQTDNLSTPILDALIPRVGGGADFTLEIWRTSQGSVLPKLDWARNYLAHDNLVPPSLTAPYKVAFDKSQGFIYLYDTQKKKAAIWVAEDSKISLNSFVTPFRIIFSWMAEDFGGEIVHASAISKGGNGIIINGASGSGKSTLAILCVLNGFEIIADDVVLFHDGLISAVYKYAKVDPRSSPLDLSHLRLFQMESSPDAKNILDLTQFGERFVQRAKAIALILPVFVHLNQHSLISPSIAIKLLAPNSLRELMGGTPYNFKNLVNLTRALPNYRIALSTDNNKNIDSINSIFSELK
jgi:hypothetical protein